MGEFLMDDKVKIEFIGMGPTEALRDYVTEKMTKHPRLLDTMTSMTIYLKESVFSRGVKADFSIEVNAKLPKTMIHVTEVGADMYALIDEASDKLFRRLKRYMDKQFQWEGEGSWKVLDAIGVANEEMEMENKGGGDYADYVPMMVERTTMDYMTPMDEAEAIEHMELSGESQYLFKRKDAKWCMVYIIESGMYGIIEQGEDRLEL